MGRCEDGAGDGADRMVDRTARVWTKRAERPLRGWWHPAAVWLAARWLGVPVPWRTVRQRDGRALLAYEHGRLQALRAAGEAVPPVLSFDGGTLVTGDVGRSLVGVLGELSDDGRRLALMCAAADDLARFHARGHWHGGAQARNMAWDGHRFARLDFEEGLHPPLPLETVQLYDALQLLLSLARFLQPMGPTAVRRVLQAYRGASLKACAALGRPAPDLPGFVRRLLPRLRRLQRLDVVLDGLEAFVAIA